MTEQNLKWFDELTKDRSESARMLEKPSMRGVQCSVVDKYSDQAHFIYELLQNADDVCATSSHFRLEKHGLVFTHNGTVRFTVSNPHTEDSDSSNGTLGHINAITSIANSNKTESSIGKFGVGFKAVFQYTQTPHIYDPRIRFKIERFIVPHILDTDFEGRKPLETVFYFPFDHKAKEPQECYDEIFDKLKGLEFPLLFLSNLTSVSFETPEVKGKYAKKTSRILEKEDITAQWLNLTLSLNGKSTFQELLTFTRNNSSGYPCSIGYALGEHGHLVPIDRTAFCFFPTKETTNLKFIVHAPFLLTDSREGIKAGEKHNQELVHFLAQIAADSLPILRDEKLINDGIIDIVPYEEARFSELDDRRKISFRPFYTACLAKLQTDELLPSTSELYAESENAYWASVPRIAQMISNEQLAFLTGNKGARWVFPSFGWGECLRKNKDLADYINNITDNWLDEKDILTGWKHNGREVVKGISADFIQQQSHKWLFEFYQWLSETTTRTELAEKRPFFLDGEGNAVAVYNEFGQRALFLPDNDGEGYATLSAKLFTTVKKQLKAVGGKQTQSVEEFFARFGIQVHTAKDEIESAIKRMLSGNLPADNFFAKAFKYFKDECPQNEVQAFIEKIRSIAFLPYETKNGKSGFSTGHGLYFPSKKLVSFYSPRRDTKFISWKALCSKYPEADRETLKTFFGKLGVSSRDPSKRDMVFNIILPHWRTNGSLGKNTLKEELEHFKIVFEYYMELSQHDSKEFLQQIKELPILLYTTKQNRGQSFWGKAAEIYLPTADLETWFEVRRDAKFLLLETYRKTVGKKDIGRLKDFFRDLGVSSSPRIIYASYDKKIDGMDELISAIDDKRSKVLWNILAKSWSSYENSLMVVMPQYGRRGAIKSHILDNSSVKESLCKRKWILNKANELVSAEAVTVQALADEYDTASAGAESLIRFLGIHDEAKANAHLSEEEKRKIQLAEEFEQSGLSEDEIRNAIEDAKRRKNVHAAPGKGRDGKVQIVPSSSLIKEIENRRSAFKNGNSSAQNISTSCERFSPGDASEDADEYTPKAVNYGRKLDRAKDRYASELDRIEREQALNDKANALPRYSYGWFLALLELESMENEDKDADGKTISISFGKVERDAKSTRTIVLKEPNRFIPQSVEEFSGVRLDLDFGNGHTGKLRIESFAAREFSLLGMLESADALNGIDLGQVLEARIDVQSPAFLLRELLERFRELQFDEKFDMKAGLTPDIEFVFGPPGTGKTTHLAEKVLIPRMCGAKKTRILVLTPTNKAADVLTTRIMESMEGDADYLNWLVRFGTSADEQIEKAGLWRDRSFDIDSLDRSITVTTIARFAYDGFAGETSKKLHEMKWDVIVFDEASMISLANIIYPLFAQKPQKFIIAGDPFQIEPIVAVEEWKDENIYTLVGLNKAGSFAKPVTEPHNYPVTNLEIQFRSIAAIGVLFSRFTYDGILKHHRDAGTRRPLRFNGCDAKPINLIKFPVSKFESIYRAKRLESGTPYQTYSALLTFEMTRWLASQIHENHAVKARIGIIAPYRAQANVLSRLNDSWANKPDGVEIQVGTIHGFQGDQCDIIIAIFNPPPIISTSPRMFLNKQNILNVAISRARDYLFILMPDKEAEGFENLRKIARIEELARSGNQFSEFSSRTIEKMIWGNERYLEENTFSTGHQMVNVYRRPERCYEVRSDNTAIDVQIYDDR